MLTVRQHKPNRLKFAFIYNQQIKSQDSEHKDNFLLKQHLYLSNLEQVLPKYTSRYVVWGYWNEISQELAGLCSGIHC